MEETWSYMWFRMICLMEVCKIRHGTKICILWEKKNNVPNTPFNITKFSHLFLVIINYIFQQSINSPKCGFVKTSLAFYMFFSEVNMYNCVPVIFLWSVNKLLSHVKPFKRYLLEAFKWSPLPLVIFWGAEFGGGGSSYLFPLKIAY